MQNCDRMVIRSWTSKILNLTIEIDLDKCNGNGSCVAACPTGVFEVVDGKAICLTIDDCIECCDCVVACREKAIKHSSCLQ